MLTMEPIPREAQAERLRNPRRSTLNLNSALSFMGLVFSPGSGAGVDDGSFVRAVVFPLLLDEEIGRDGGL